MDTDTAAIGARVARARERAGWTQQALSSAADIERSALAKIERGRRGISAIELVSIARALNLRVGWLLEDPPTAVVAHRAQVASGTELAAIDQQLEALTRDVEFVASLAPHIVAHEVGEIDVPQSNEEADALAGHARRLMEMSDSEPLLNIVDAVAGIGLIAFSSPLGSDTADAGCILLHRGAVALVNSSNAVGKRRLALAHELGHYLVGDDYTVDWRVAEASRSRGLESRLDHFARALLAPAESFRDLWNDLRARNALRTTAVLAASRFQVDMSTLAKRLDELALADPTECDVVRSISTSRAEIVEYGLAVPYDLEQVSLPRSYQQAIFGLYRSERISESRTLDLLQGQFEPNDLPALNSVHHDAIWSIIQ